MRRLRLFIAAALAASALAAPAADAATGAGWDCVADDLETDLTLLVAGGSSFPLPPNVPPEGSKVITGWRVKVGPGLAPIRQRLEVFAIQNEAGEYKKVGESPLETLVEGQNSFPARIPVREGNSVGLFGPEGTLFCDEEEGAISLVYEGSAGTGETKPFTLEPQVGTPVVAIVEGDADGDGYGDETQDGCPTSSALQSPCPTLTTVTRHRVKPNAILVRVAVSNESAVQVLGQVGWIEDRGKRSERFRILGLGEKTPRLIPAGGTGFFRLRLWKAIRRHLEQMPPKQSLRVKLRVGVTDVFGAAIAKKTIVRLHGRG